MVSSFEKTLKFRDKGALLPNRYNQSEESAETKRRHPPGRVDLKNTVVKRGSIDNGRYADWTPDFVTPLLILSDYDHRFLL